eukprot:gene53058-64813_t
MSSPPHPTDVNPQKRRTGLSRIVHAGGYSMEGLRAGWHETAFRQEAIAAALMVPIAFWLGQTWVEVALLAGSVLMMLAIMAMYWQAGTTDVPTLMQHGFPSGRQTWLWLAFFASFAVKVPMWPVHTWLPDAHVEAPTAGSVILAGVLLKMGAYGFLRFSLPLLPEASQFFAPFIYVLSIVAVVYTSLVALAQTDMKKLIAYSSVAHMGIVTLGIFTFLHAWNDYWWPLISATKKEMYTLTIGIASSQTNFAQSEGLGFLAAQAVFASLPALI